MVINYMKISPPKKQWLDEIIKGSKRNIDFSHKKLKKFSVPSGSVGGDFSCSNSKLKNKLKSLEGAPKLILR